MRHAGAGAGVDASSIEGIGIVGAGGAAQLRLVPPTDPGAVGAPTAGAHEIGEVFLDAEAGVYVCVASGTPGSWRAIGSTGPGGTSAGGYILLDAPTRGFDSRDGRSPVDPAAGAKGPFPSGGAPRVIDLSVAGGLPREAVGALINVTLTETVNTGFVTVYSASVRNRPNASTVNWSTSNENIANTTVTAVQDGRLKVFAANPCHVIIDVIGFQL